jgi:hypothetical protein
MRPDGHIGYRSAGTEVSGIDRYLARWLPGAGNPSPTHRVDARPKSAE